LVKEKEEQDEEEETQAQQRERMGLSAQAPAPGPRVTRVIIKVEDSSSGEANPVTLRAGFGFFEHPSTWILELIDLQIATEFFFS
jgi:hypothetical protein